MNTEPNYGPIQEYTPKHESLKITSRGVAAVAVAAVSLGYGANEVFSRVLADEPVGDCAVGTVGPGEGGISAVTDALEKLDVKPTDIPNVVPEGQQAQQKISESTGEVVRAGDEIEVCLDEDKTKIVLVDVPNVQ